MKKLESFIREAASGTHLLPLSHEGIMPGSILDAHWASSLRNWFRERIFNRESLLHYLGKHKGYGWELLNISPDEFASRFEQGSLLTGTMTDRFDFSGSINLRPFGVNLILDIEDSVSAQITVSDVRVRVFDRGFAGHELRRKMRELKQENDPRYADVDECYLVVEAFHLDGLKWQFNGESVRKFQSELEKKGINLADLGASWGGASSSVLMVSGQSDAPIAVRGLKL